jgi:hypothetical protein
MGALGELLKRPQPVVWLDSHAYCAHLLAKGNAPWLDTTAFVAWQRKSMGLLKPDVVSLPLVPAIDAWLAAHPELAAAMAAKFRTVYPLKTLLADEALRAHLVELTRGLRVGVAGVSGPPLALVLPSPRAWVAIAYRQAHGAVVEVVEDEADSASVFIADFLRVFGEAGVDALMLEAPDGGTADAATCQSVLNVATHYRWDVLTPDALHSNLRFLRIAPDAQPERVLQQIANLR